MNKHTDHDNDMNFIFSSFLSEWKNRQKKKKRSILICCVLAVVVAFTTVIEMIQPAVTITKKTSVLDCDYEVHEHTDACYEISYDESGNETGRKLICGKADYVIHTHTAECYRTIYHEDEMFEENVLICELPEIKKHVHDESCYQEVKTLYCDQDHEHDETCYETHKELICDKAELHIHEDGCYDEEGHLICGQLELREHVHNENCFKEIEIAAEEESEELITSEEETAAVLYEPHTEEYAFTIPETGFISLEQIAEELQLAGDEPQNITGISAAMANGSDESFTSQVADVSFSESSPVWIGKAEEPTTVGALIEENDLNVQYSSQRSAEEIAALNEQSVNAGDYALISVRPFVTEEQLNVTMANGDQYTILLSDGQIHKTVISADGYAYEITVTYGPDAQLPENADLLVSELSGEAYRDYVNRTAAALDALDFAYARIFDISIMDGAGNIIQPASEVEVSITVSDCGNDLSHVSVMHFKGESEDPEEMNTEAEGTTVTFNTDSFSAYAIVQGPSGIPAGYTKPATLAQLHERAMDGLYIGTTGGYYMTNTSAAGSQDATTTGIVKTTPANNLPLMDSASLYYFEEVEGTNDQFHIYTFDNENNKIYVTNNGDANLTFSASPETAWTVIFENDGRVRFRNGDRYWNMWNGTGGNHIAAWTSATDSNNYFYLWHYDDTPGDPYGLDGVTNGLMFWSTGTTGKALMAESSDSTHLVSLPLTVMSKTGNNDDKLFVPDNSDISMWTFHWINSDHYYLTTVADGITKYLKITRSGISLVDEPDASCEIQVVPGSGTHAGELCLKANGATLTYSGNVETGFGISGSAGMEWLRLVEISELTQDYFLTYSAVKVGVSDPEVTNGSRIIVYTRVWNEETLKYDFYAVDHDGTLVHCYESGDDIQWTGTRLNSMLWNFVEYYWEGTSDPNYYYELYNQYSEKYIAPQVSDGQILSDNTIGINMNGRRDGHYYSPIVAWDEEYYAYVGLKADVQSGRIVSCPKSEADDFYFAIMQDLPVDDELITVETVDHVANGIVMKMADFSTRKDMSDFLGSDAGGAVYNVDFGLLSTNLGPNGYPTTTAGNDLSAWFGNAPQVNHLFIQSTYSATGYYEYDASENFASLKGSDFLVYQEIGTVDSKQDEHYTHGQFFPYNDLKAGTFASANPKNLTTAGGEALSEDDPRKYERMYLVQQPNYYMGMEVQATFTQTPDGLDDWGHDIIYEFTGDDDFWLYVDGELIIDLGGIHNALSGSVNYRTGDVYVNYDHLDKGGYHKTLRQLFEENYRKRNPNATDTEVNAYLAQYFEEGKTIFKDYTTHTMKIFYLERGAGASNLHMRFNLASIKPGTVQLSKRLSGVDSTESILALYPYQIYYKKEGSDQEYLLSNKQPNDPLNDTDYVFYKDSVTPASYQHSGFTAGGITYNNVFLLKPGETVEINFPSDMSTYRIVECGMNTDVYDEIKANDIALTGTSGSGYEPNRKDFGIEEATTDERARVIYDNHVSPNALRTLTLKKLVFKEDGVTPVNHDQDDTVFNFRLYLGTEFDDEPPAANMHTYHVRDPYGNYCRWDAENQTFESIGKSDYSLLTDAEKTSVSFTTSINGAISRIPIDYTVEVRNVLAGTKFRVQERPYEIPDGYSFQKYIYRNTDYAGGDAVATAGILDTVQAGFDPHVDICNLKGWGLRVNKVWTDADYMSDREPTYFAIYTKDADNQLNMVDGSLRQLAYTESSIYWYYLHLPVQDVAFEDYYIYEVVPVNPVSDASGNWSAQSVTPIGQGEPICIAGTQKGETVSSKFEYTVLYERGTIIDDSNVKVDEVVNNRPGIILKKQDWSGQPLADAVFELKDNTGQLIGRFTSDSTGLITVAFLRDDVDYTLSEITAPHGYHGLEAPAVIRLSQGYVSVSGISSDYYILEQGEGTTPTLILKNRPFALRALKKGVKTDGTEEYLSGVPFELHREVTIDNVTSMELHPLAGYENLISMETTGLIPDVDETLSARTYYLIENAAADGYLKMSENIRFTITDTGQVILSENAMAALESDIDPQTGTITYTIVVRNIQAAAPIRIIKVNEFSQPLEGAEFTISGEGITTETVVSTIAPGETDALIYTNGAVPIGTYTLNETDAPDGYNRLVTPVTITVSEENHMVMVRAYYNGLELEYPHVSKDPETGVWTVTVINHSGYELPATGADGTALFTSAGIMLITLSLILLILQRKQPA